MRSFTGILLLCGSLHASEPSRLEIPQKKGKLVAALDLPDGKGPFPVILLQPGSGPTDKDGNSGLALKTDCYKMLGAALAKQGIAVVRVDKRGVAESAGALEDPKNFFIAHYVDDVVAWTKLLRQDTRFSKVFYLGHSEGSMVGAIAAQREKFDGFISLCGPGKNLGATLRDQLKPKLTDDMYSKAVKTIERLEAGQETDDFPKELTVLFYRNVQPYLISMLKVNPAEDFGKLSCPCLILTGTKDIQVPAEHAQLLAKANPKAKLATIEKMTHVLKKQTNDDLFMKSYTDPTMPLADGLVEAITSFVKP